MLFVLERHIYRSGCVDLSGWGSIGPKVISRFLGDAAQ